MYYVIGILAAIILWVIWAYNTFVRYRNRTKESWADIDVQLKRRYDLIPNLVKTVEGYAAHEKETLAKVTEMRTRAMGMTDPEQKAEAENMLTDALKSLFAVSENYPDLKANQNFLELQKELSDTENKIQAARRFYNTNVRDYNTALQSFPQKLVAGPFGFEESVFFEIENEEEKEPVSVNFK